MITPQFHPLAIVTLEVVSAMAILGSFAGVLPPLAALGALVWYAVQIYESDTVQHLINKDKHVPRKHMRKHKKDPPDAVS